MDWTLAVSCFIFSNFFVSLVLQAGRVGSTTRAPRCSYAKSRRQIPNFGPKCATVSKKPATCKFKNHNFCDMCQNPVILPSALRNGENVIRQENFKLLNGSKPYRTFRFQDSSLINVFRIG